MSLSQRAASTLEWLQHRSWTDSRLQHLPFAFSLFLKPPLYYQPTVSAFLSICISRRSFAPSTLSASSNCWDFMYNILTLQHDIILCTAFEDIQNNVTICAIAHNLPCCMSRTRNGPRKLSNLEVRVWAALVHNSELFALTPRSS